MKLFGITYIVYSSLTVTWYVTSYFIDARSTCQDRGGDLLAMATPAEMNEIAAKIRFYTYYWIGLNDRDYRNSYYWSNTDANGMINWGSGAPDNTGYTSMKINFLTLVLFPPLPSISLLSLRLLPGKCIIA